MDYEQSLSYIASLKSFNGAPALDRMKRLMSLLGDPQETLNIVHVAGTNGKGSAAAMISAILRAAGVRTGLTVSPYIVDFCERIQINGEMIPREILAREISRVREAADTVGGVTQFEAITAAAFSYFAREGCGAVVAEVGLGGRFDATNVIHHPVVSVITSIGLDHTAILGDTLELIAAEKCGIIKPGSPVVCAPEQAADALLVIRATARERGCELIEPQITDLAELHMGLDGSEFCYKGSRLRVPLIGRHQVINALAAIEAAIKAASALTSAEAPSSGIGAPGCESVAASPPPSSPPPSGGIAATGGEMAGAVARGLAAVRFPARLEIMRREPPVLLDGAHNPDGMRSLAAALKLLDGRPITAVMGMLADKDVETASAIIAFVCRRVFCVTPQNPRALAAVELAGIVGKYCGEVASFDALPQALAEAVAAAELDGGAAVICGSLYLAAEARPMLT